MTAFIANPLPTRPAAARPHRRARCPPRATSTAPRAAPMTLQPVRPHDKAGLPAKPLPSAEAIAEAFGNFFSAMPGSWNSERTYHYVGDGARESSQTTFEVMRLNDAAIDKVLSANSADTSLAALAPWRRDNAHGFRVAFNTRMGSDGRYVRAETNLAFVPAGISEDGVLRGSYYRDLGYEEKAPIKADFVFDCNRSVLTMTTFYTKVVSVDQISLVSPILRLRNIVNYARPPEGCPLEDVVLVGFGVEKRGEPKKLVE